MEWIYIVIQIIFLYLTISPRGHKYLVGNKEIFKSYIFVEMIFQALFLVANVILFFVSKNAMIFVTASHIILAGIIQVCFDCVAKNRFFNTLKEKIIEYDLTTCPPVVIRNFFLENLEFVYSIKEINKCLSKIHK